MRLTSSITSGFAAAMLLSAPNAQAATALLNGGFESILDGWTADPDFVQVSTGLNHLGLADRPYGPKEGSRMAMLTAYSPPGAQEGDPQAPPTVMTQTFSTAGGWFSGWAAFLAADEMPFNDDAHVRIFGGGLDLTLFSSSIAEVGDYGRTPWTRFSTLLSAGDYTIEVSVRNGGDPVVSSMLLVDGFAVTAGVPEPAAWALMILGFGTAGSALRRRRAVLA